MGKWNLSFDYAAILIVGIVLIWFVNEKRIPSRAHKVFLGIVVSLLAVFFVEVAEVHAFRHRENCSDEFISGILYVQMLATNVAAMFFAYYVKLITKTSYKALKVFAVESLISITIIISMIIGNPFMNWLFEFENDKLAMNYGIIVPYTISAIYLLAGVYRVCRLTKQLTFRKSVVLMFDFALCFLGLFLQLAELATILGLTLAVTCLSFYHYIQNPLSVTDTTTGLWNRKFMGEFIRYRFERKKPLGVVFIAMDDFKIINKNHGVTSGDYLLSQIGAYLNKFRCHKEVFRFGSDQFCFVLDRDISQIEFIAEEVHERFKHPWFLDTNDSIMTSASICIIECPKDAATYRELVEVMDYSMALAKQTKKGGITRTNEIDLTKIQKDKAIEKAVKLAMDRDELMVYYQPIHSVADEVYSSAEALVRLKDDELGWISPEDFIPIAEKNGLMVEMGDMILEKVCKFIRDFDLANTSVEYIEVNISAVQLVQQNFADKVMEILEKYDVNPSQINMEITETAQTGSMNVVNENIKRLVEYGIKFSLDDYGSGNSNIDYINKMPFSIIKLDKYIVWDAFNNDKAGITLKYTIGMLNALRLLIVAEGVETEDMKNHLVEIGCHYMQGWYYSKAVCDRDFIELIEKDKEIQA